MAVLAVFLFHLDRRWLPGGFVGVDVFFVISGFLITSILLRENERATFTFSKFYQRRIARLYPAFLAVGLSTLAATAIAYSSQDAASSGVGLASAALSLANLKYMLQGNYFVISPDAQPFLHCWSLSVEEQFYVIFPALLWWLSRRPQKERTRILVSLCALSLFSCVLLTYRRPEWAFYLLPARAWELMAGSLLADHNTRYRGVGESQEKLWGWFSGIGLILIAFSLFALKEGTTFPGYRAIAPVLGATLLLGSVGRSRAWPQRLLEAHPLPFIGRMSYSLYLWHWPVFSLVDYRACESSATLRMALKAVLSGGLATLCYFCIERPGRSFFNQPRHKRLAFAFLVSTLLVCVSLGAVTRRVRYVDAVEKDVRTGGVSFAFDGATGSMVLMGDSNGSMYGTLLRDVAREVHMNLNVISVSGGDPLPLMPSGVAATLWDDSLTFVKKTRPDVLVLACLWAERLEGDRRRLDFAVRELKQHVGRLIILTQPPKLPAAASRAAMREGSRAPFREDSEYRASRELANQLVKQWQTDNVTIVDIERLFTMEDGSLRFKTESSDLVFQDETHLSGVGANLVKRELLKALEGWRSIGAPPPG